MTAALFAFFGAIVGALLSVIGLESYKRHRDRQGTASATAGEISAILNMTAKRNYVPWFTAMQRQLDAGHPVDVPNIVGAQQGLEFDPVVAKYLDRVGAL